MTEEKQRLTRIDKEMADRLVAAGLGAPAVFAGEDGSYWVLSDQLRDYARKSEVSGES